MDEFVRGVTEYARGARRPLEGKVELEGLQAPVEITTDRWGVPHIYASSREDLFFAQGSVHATERLWQLDLNRRFAQGRLSEILGETGLAFDRYHRTMGLGRTARPAAADADDITRETVLPYWRGLVAGATSQPAPVEYSILGIEPDLSSNLEDAIFDVFSIAMLMSLSLSANWTLELMRLELAKALGPQRARELSPFSQSEPPIAVPASDEASQMIRELLDTVRAAGTHPTGRGSNNWVLAGTKTTTGAPLLANDPHLGVSMPSLWMEIHLSSPDFEVAGVSLPGVPGVLIGHNRDIAWGFTNTGADVQDLYLEKLSADGTQYLFGGEWHDVEVTREKIRVRDQADPHIHEVRLTRHGPLVTSLMRGAFNIEVEENAVSEALALRWIQADIQLSLGFIVNLNTASTWDEFREAASQWPAAGQNMVFADREGNIGYQFSGTVPVRPPGVSGATPHPGWESGYEWIGTIPFQNLPRSFNPDTGFIATANHRMADADYPFYLTNDWELPYRIRRITSLLTSKERLSAEDCAEIQFDTHSGFAEEVLPLLLQVRPRSPAARDAMKILKKWNLRMEANSVGAAIFMVWVEKVAGELFRTKLGEVLFDSYFWRREWTALWGFTAIANILRNPQSYWIEPSGKDGSTIKGRDSLMARALEEACVDLEARFGKDRSEWRWGRLHRIHFRHPIAGFLPQLDEPLSAGPFEAPGADDTVNRGVFNPAEEYMDTAVASYRQIIDLEDFDRSVSIITTGNSGNPASPYYRDQAELWLKGEYHPMPFSKSAVEEVAVGTLHLLPANSKH